MSGRSLAHGFHPTRQVLRLDASAADQLAQLAPKAFRTLAREIHPDGRSPLDEEERRVSIDGQPRQSQRAVPLFGLI